MPGQRQWPIWDCKCFEGYRKGCWWLALVKAERCSQRFLYDSSIVCLCSVQSLQLVSTWGLSRTHFQTPCFHCPWICCLTQCCILSWLRKLPSCVDSIYFRVPDSSSQPWHAERQQNDSRTVTPRTVEQLQTRQDDAIPEWDVPCQNACCTCQVLELAVGGGWTMVDFFLWPDGVSSLNHTTSVLGGSWRQVSPSILWGRQWLVGATILESTP